MYDKNILYLHSLKRIIIKTIQSYDFLTACIPETQPIGEMNIECKLFSTLQFVTYATLHGTELISTKMRYRC